ncbi:MAG: hypothetical protein RRB13_08705 [bacterium]|nr:hypothetical protein [bacterium]
MDLTLNTEMYNLYLGLPFPMLNVALGGGVGNRSLVCSTCDGLYTEESASQTFLNLGWPLVLGIFDVPVGYHQVAGKVRVPRPKAKWPTKALRSVSRPLLGRLPD